MPSPPKFARFNDLDRAAANVDYHVHTSQTDGEANIADNLRAAHAAGLAALAFTEHVRKSTAWFPGFARAVREAARDYPGMRVYVGCEAKALDDRGALDAPAAVLAHCDIVVGVVHRFPGYGRDFLQRMNALAPEAFAQTQFDLEMGLLQHASIHVLGHPGGMYQRRYGAYPAHCLRALMEASLRRGIAIEINSSYLVDVPGFLALCAEVNPYVSIGSDAHRPQSLGRCRDLLHAHGIVGG